MMPPAATRSRLSVATSVWQALLLREASTRLMTGRAGWLWLLVEPAAHVVFLMMMFGVILERHIAGANVEVFLLTGVLGFFLVRNIARRGTDAIKANAALFSYRQVKPIDTVLVRGVFEASVLALIGLLLLAACAFFAIPVVPHDPLRVIIAGWLLWGLGMGLGLILSVAGTLVPEIGKVAAFAFTPLYFMSAVMFPLAAVPAPVRGYLLANPIVHGIEAMRGGFFVTYHSDPGISLGYLFFSAIVTVFAGLVLHAKYARRLAAR
jgi:capsular polysaccharide transport system permease protein